MIRPVTTPRRRTSRTGRTLIGVFVAASAVGCSRPAEPGVLQVERVLGEPGRQPGQFSYPRGMDTFDLDGRTCLVIVDKSARIQIIDALTGAPIGSIRTPEFDLGMPTGLSVAAHPMDPDRPALWVADTHEHRVLVYDLPFDNDSKPTEPRFSFGSYGEGPGQFIYPTDIAVQTGPDGLAERLFVSEYGGNDRVCEFRVIRDADTVSFEFVRQIGYSGVAMDAPEDDPAALSRPQSVNLRRNNTELVVTDVGRNRVVRFDLTTGQVAGWTDGTTGPDGEPFDPLRFPYGLSLIGDDRAVLTEFGASRLRVIDLDSGRTIRVIGGPGRGAGQLATPWACVPYGNELMILDSGNDRVQVIRWPGAWGPLAGGGGGGA